MKRNHLQLFGAAYLLMMGFISLTGCPNNSPTAAATPTPTPPTNLNVAGAVTIGSSITGDQTSSPQYYQSAGCALGSCAGENAYSIDITNGPITISFSTCASDPGATIEPVLYTMDGAGTELSCSYDGCGTGNFQTTLQEVFSTNGRYYIVVDGANCTYGTYKLDVTSP